MKIDACYCTYKKDLMWACYSLQLLRKHLQGEFGIVVVAEEDCKDTIDQWGIPGVTYQYVKPWIDGYHHAMYQKLNMDTRSEADLLMLLDSDHLLMRPTSIESTLENGKPLVFYRNWDDYPDQPDMRIAREQWGPPTERCLGIPLDHDYMCGPPFNFWRDTFAATRARIEKVTGQPLYDVCYSDLPYDYRNFLNHPKRFCDYEALGLYSVKFEPERYALKHLPRDNDNPFRVYWSHGDWSASLQRKLDDLLSA